MSKKNLQKATIHFSKIQRMDASKIKLYEQILNSQVEPFLGNYMLLDLDAIYQRTTIQEIVEFLSSFCNATLDFLTRHNVTPQDTKFLILYEAWTRWAQALSRFLYTPLGSKQRKTLLFLLNENIGKWVIYPEAIITLARYYASCGTADEQRLVESLYQQIITNQCQEYAIAELELGHFFYHRAIEAKLKNNESDFQINGQKAFNLYDTAHKKNLSIATLYLAECYYWGVGTFSDVTSATRLRDPLFNSDDSTVQSLLGSFYFYTAEKWDDAENCYKKFLGNNFFINQAGGLMESGLNRAVLFKFLPVFQNLAVYYNAKNEISKQDHFNKWAESAKNAGKEFSAQYQTKPLELLHTLSLGAPSQLVKKFKAKMKPLSRFTNPRSATPQPVPNAISASAVAAAPSSAAAAAAAAATIPSSEAVLYQPYGGSKSGKIPPKRKTKRADKIEIKEIVCLSCNFTGKLFSSKTVYEYFQHVNSVHSVEVQQGDLLHVCPYCPAFSDFFLTEVDFCEHISKCRGKC